MKLVLTLLCILLSFSLSAQINPEKITGSWVKTKVTYKDGTELSDNIDAKYFYLKYTFSGSHKFGIGFSYDSNSTDMSYSIKGNQLTLHTSGLDNNLTIEKLTANELILSQQQTDTAKDNRPLKYFFTAEQEVQKSFRLTPPDRLHANGTDTVYNQNPKLYPVYTGKQSFHNQVVDNVRAGINMDGRSGEFKATFIVSKLGVADSVKIVESISPEYDKQFIKVFNKEKKNWKPALLDGKPVAVQSTLQVNYFTAEEVVPTEEYWQEAQKAYKKMDYKQALYYYDRSLEVIPFDPPAMIRRTICLVKLGQQTAACAEIQKLKDIGNSSAYELMANFCR